MGQSPSSQEGAVLEEQYQSSLKLFSSYEQAEIKRIFDAICKTPVTELEESLLGFEKSQLQGYIGGKLAESVTNRLYELLKVLQLCGKNKPEDVPISHHAFVVAMAMVFKGTLDQRCHLIHCLATGNRNGVSLDELAKFVSGILQHYEEALKICNKLNHWKLACSSESQKKLMKFALHDAIGLKDGETDCVLDESDISSWLQKEPFFQTLLINLLKVCFSPPVDTTAEGASAALETSSTSDDLDMSIFHDIKGLPQCHNIDWEKASTILDLPSVLLINHHLPHTCRGQWRHCFSSQTDGASFSTMVRHISKQGPLLMIVKDSDGNVFGGFASQSWELGPNFTGSSQCFLFSLSPSFGIYEATQHNDHFMYFNTDQQTLPNGLGMGGQFDFFGFWIDQEFGSGHSKAKPKCTTFDSPQLSAKENFTIDVLEAWAVGPPPRPKDDDLYEEDQTSILDRDPEAQAILDLVGKERKSEGLREQEATADIPEEHQLYPSGQQDN